MTKNELAFWLVVLVILSGGFGLLIGKEIYGTEYGCPSGYECTKMQENETMCWDGRYNFWLENQAIPAIHYNVHLTYDNGTEILKCLEAKG